MTIFVIISKYDIWVEACLSTRARRGHPIWMSPPSRGWCKHSADITVVIITLEGISEDDYGPAGLIVCDGVSLVSTL